MELTVQSYDKEYMIEVDADDAMETIRQKVASATGLCDDSFHMGFGGNNEGEDVTQLSAGDKVVLTKTKKYEAIAALSALGETDLSSDRLANVEDAEVARLLLQAEVSTAIPNGFLRYSTLTKLDLGAVPVVTEVGCDFVYRCTALREVDLSGLTNVTKIGPGFLAFCTSLTTLDLAGLRSVTQIGDFFLSRCARLHTIDFSKLRSVRTVGRGFLLGCAGLRRVDLSPLCSATVGRDYLLHCKLEPVIPQQFAVAWHAPSCGVASVQSEDPSADEQQDAHTTNSNATSQ